MLHVHVHGICMVLHGDARHELVRERELHQLQALAPRGRRPRRLQQLRSGGGGIGRAPAPQEERAQPPQGHGHRLENLLAELLGAHGVELGLDLPLGDLEQRTLLAAHADERLVEAAARRGVVALLHVALAEPPLQRARPVLQALERAHDLQRLGVVLRGLAG